MTVLASGAKNNYDVRQSQFMPQAGFKCKNETWMQQDLNTDTNQDSIV